MDKEIERTFLVNPDKLPELDDLSRAAIMQVYLSENPCTRVRLSKTKGVEKGCFTVKGPGLVERVEIECEIPAKTAKDILCEKLWLYFISKIRFRYGNWEIDKFVSDAHDGLWLAEIELESESQEFVRPEWLGKEVSNDPRYTNLALARDGVPKEN